MRKKVLVIAAHPDDELLGCGGTVAKHVLKGDQVTSIIICEGDSLRYDGLSENHQSQIFKAAQVMGVKDIRSLKFPDQKLETILLTDLIEPILKIVREIKPQIIYCQFGGDINRDHKILFEAILVATRPTEEFIESIYAFDTVSSTEWGFPRNFVPDTWIDISSTLDIKLKAMSMYKTELRDYPHPRSLKAIEYKAYATGAECLMKAAESFITVRRTLRNIEDV